MNAPAEKPIGQLERVLRSGGFAVTCELGPPRGANAENVLNKARKLQPWVDAANLTDGQGAVVRMSSLAASRLCLDAGLEPILQLQCRDRNRIALQAEVLGAGALGIPNLVCLTGDHQRFGDHPEAKGVFDLDSVQFLYLVSKLRKGTLLNDRPLTAAPNLFLGCVENPFAAPLEFRAVRLGKKIQAGARFCQTQIIYDVATFARFMAQARDLGLTRRAFILAGVGPIRSAQAVKFMRDSVPGLVIPDAIVRRMERTPADQQAEEGVRICLEVIEQVRAIPGLAGVHIMAPSWESIVPEIVERAGLKDRQESRESATDSNPNSCLLPPAWQSREYSAQPSA